VYIRPSQWSTIICSKFLLSSLIFSFCPLDDRGVENNDDLGAVPEVGCEVAAADEEAAVDPKEKPAEDDGFGAGAGVAEGVEPNENFWGAEALEFEVNAMLANGFALAGGLPPLAIVDAGDVDAPFGGARVIEANVLEEEEDEGFDDGMVGAVGAD